MNNPQFLKRVCALTVFFIPSYLYAAYRIHPVIMAALVAILIAGVAASYWTTKEDTHGQEN